MSLLSSVISPSFLWETAVNHALWWAFLPSCLFITWQLLYQNIDECRVILQRPTSQTLAKKDRDMKNNNQKRRRECLGMCAALWAWPLMGTSLRIFLMQLQRADLHWATGEVFELLDVVVWGWLMTGLWHAALWSHCSLAAWYSIYTYKKTKTSVENGKETRWISLLNVMLKI